MMSYVFLYIGIYLYTIEVKNKNRIKSRNIIIYVISIMNKLSYFIEPKSELIIR